jgi:FdhD protein
MISPAEKDEYWYKKPAAGIHFMNSRVKRISLNQNPGAVPTGYSVLEGEDWRAVPEGEVIEEQECCIYVNGKELVTLAATPVQMEALALGFLANEGLISGMAEVADISIRGSGTCVDVWLTHGIREPKRKVLTSGCTGGVTFDELAGDLPPLDFNIVVQISELREAARSLYSAGRLYSLTRGVHTSILWRNGEQLAAAEDVGRHNTLDKLQGYCLQHELPTRGSVLFSTGRISSEMLTKALRMKCPVVVSRTSATSLSVQLARHWNITLVGYFRGNLSGSHAPQLLAYSHLENLALERDL